MSGRQNGGFSVRWNQIRKTIPEENFAPKKCKKNIFVSGRKLGNGLGILKRNN